ncbi:MAG TPA: SDR family oxidoreductase [Polyangia bacterium]|jgi:NAD(P)-dependent dehydrogenase (short-subunit alcohol dehydrogenase family)
MRGKRVLVTGATTGIGRVTAVELGRAGAEVVLVARDREKAEATLAELRAAGAPPAHALMADLSLMSSVRALAEEVRGRFDRIDVLVNNAGAIFGSRALTAEGFERTFALNHLSYFLLTQLVLDRVPSGGRIVNVASEAHRGGRVDFDDLQLERRYTAFGAYCLSKLMNLLFTFELARRVAGRGITANAAHPGPVASNFGRSNRGVFGFLFALAGPFMLTPGKGARTQIWLASSPDVAGVSGKYFAKCREKKPSPRALDEAVQKRLWDVTAGLVGVGAGNAAETRPA